MLRVLLVLLLGLGSLVGAFAAGTNGKEPADVFVYAVAWEKKCGQSSAVAFATKWADEKTYAAVKAKLIADLKEQYPRCNVLGSSSWNKLQDKARSVAMIQYWEPVSKDCLVRVIVTEFDDTLEGAMKRAMKRVKPGWSVEILTSKYFPKIQHAPMVLPPEKPDQATPSGNIAPGKIRMDPVRNGSTAGERR